MIFLMSCKTAIREEIDATIWLNNSPLPATICEREPELKNYGFYRRLNSGQLEFMSFCRPCTEGVKDCAKFWLGIRDDDFNRLMDKYVPHPQQPKMSQPPKMP